MKPDTLASHTFDIPSGPMHCLERPGSGTPLVLLHSLSGNALLFSGLLKADAAPGRRILIPDMRGRGRTPVGQTDMSLDAACADIGALLDHFDLATAVVVGHSYGGLTALRFGATYPERVEKLVLLDAAAQMHPAAPGLALITAGRLDQIFPSRALYLTMIQATPFVDVYHEEMSKFFNEDIMDVALGACTTRARFATVAAAIYQISSRSPAAWLEDCHAVKAPTLVVRADRPYFMSLPMMTGSDVENTVRAIPNARGTTARGNHLSMLYGRGAEDITDALEGFLVP